MRGDGNGFTERSLEVSVPGKSFVISCKGFTDCLTRYFNTVGSKEGWTPSTFVSSRSTRHKNEGNPTEQRPEDFMDEEDLANAEEDRRVQINAGYAALGSTEGEVPQRAAFMDLFHVPGETMGMKLMKRMGWREGQGVGPKVLRTARLGEGLSDVAGQHLFAPENTRTILFIRKDDYRGLGSDNQQPKSEKVANRQDEPGSGDDVVFGTSKALPKKKKGQVRGGIGVGILNDTGSDDEDPYEIGPRISYSKVIGGDKKKKRPVVIGTLKPVFVSKKAQAVKAAAGFRKCHDGRLPLDGFILSSGVGSMTSSNLAEQYKPSEVPLDWQSSKTSVTKTETTPFVSTADAAKVASLDVRSRAALLGETPLLGKSVFDFLTPAARQRIAASSGKTNLPDAHGEVPSGYVSRRDNGAYLIADRLPKIGADAAVAALNRGSSGWMPYADDEAKRGRYKAYLENQAGMTENLPVRAPGVTSDDWIKELEEFAHCAQIFRPVSGMMATRFTSSSSSLPGQPGPGDITLLRKPAAIQADPAEAAAKMGMFGRLTRSEEDFYPTRLLCKRFGVPAPGHVQPDEMKEPTEIPKTESQRSAHCGVEESMSEYSKTRNKPGSSKPSETAGPATNEPLISEALLGERPGDDVFRAIFGDSDDDDEGPLDE
jgi:G patch domain-containing protein 1